MESKRKLFAYKWYGEKVSFSIPSDINLIIVLVLSGDEIIYGIKPNGKICEFDSGFDSDFEYSYGGIYILNLNDEKQFNLWKNRKDSYEYLENIEYEKLIRELTEEDNE